MVLETSDMSLGERIRNVDLELSGTASAIVNQESGDSESCDSNLDG